MNTIKIKWAELREKCQKILEREGLLADEAALVVRHMTEAEALGKLSWGFYRFPDVLQEIKQIKPAAAIQVKQTSPLSVKLTAENALGITAATRAADEAIALAQEKGVALAGLEGYVGSTGCLGFYARRFAKAGLIALVCCTSKHAVAPWGSKKPLLGTNPIAFSIPNGGHPIIADLTTAAWSYDDIMRALKTEGSIPMGVVLDRGGRPSTDPNDANEGSQLPMGEYKGYALGLIIEILAGLLAQAKGADKPVTGVNGLFIIAFKPDLFISEKDFLHNVKRLVKEIEAAPLAPGFSEVHIPGFHSLEIISQREQAGEIELLERTYRRILELETQGEKHEK